MPDITVDPADPVIATRAWRSALHALLARCRMPEPIRLLLIDTPLLCLRSLAALLNRRRTVQVVGEAGTAPDGLALIQSLQPDVVVVDPGIPEAEPEFLATCTGSLLQGAVVVLTARDEDERVRHALAAGARGYTLKYCEPDELVRVIERVHAGELVVSQSSAGGVARALQAPPESSHGSPALTPREREVLALVATGRTNDEIGRVLCITGHTAKGHLVKLLRKLGLDNRVQLTAYALVHGLADQPDETPIADEGQPTATASE